MSITFKQSEPSGKNLKIVFKKLEKEQEKNKVLTQKMKEIQEKSKAKVKEFREEVKKKVEYEKAAKKLARDNKRLEKKKKELESRIKNSYIRSRIQGPWKTVTSSFDIFPEEYGLVDNHLQTFLIDVKPVLANILNGAVLEYKNFKVQCIMAVSCKLANGATQTFNIFDNNKEKAQVYENGKSAMEIASSILGNLKENFEATSEKGSGWMFNKVLLLRVNIYRMTIKKGGTYIKTPEIIANKKCVVNVQNNDDKCFIWAVLSALAPVSGKDHNYRLSKYINTEEAKTLKYDMLDFPVACDANVIQKFEKANNISISVFDYEVVNGYVVPNILYNSKYVGKQHINLLLLEDDVKSHYVWIKDFSRFCAEPHNHRKKHYCRFCLHGFEKEENLTQHIADGCSLLNDEARPVLPKDDGVENIVQFKNMNNQFKAPFAIYADFESILEKIEDDEYKNTRIFQRHKCCSYAYKVVSSYPEYQYPLQLFSSYKVKEYEREIDVCKKFVDELMEVGDKLFNIMKKNEPMVFTDDDKIIFDNAECCHICKEKYTKDCVRVRDHDHISGKFVGSAHNECNINRQNKRLFIPVIFHNMKNYDVHFIVKALSTVNRKISIIPNSTEKYMSLSVGHLRFIDSFAFMSESLEKLVNNLGGLENFKVLQSEFPYFENEKLLLLKQKGVYPYDYMDSLERFDETILPLKEEFYSKLNKCEISDKEYLHAQNIWNSFNMKSLRDYHDLYLKTDVLLLADVFEKFRTIALDIYQLDPVYYVSAPGLSWDAMLLKTKVKLSLLTDIDMFNVVSRGIRGGISMISHRYAEANNKYMNEKYDSLKEDSYIWYSDANSLYGCAMSWALPINDFKFDDVEKYTQEYIMNKKNDDTEGCILEVSLKYPEHLHDKHNDYPLAPESLIVKDEMLSPYAKYLKDKCELSSGKVSKLVPNLNDKQNYVCDYRNLKMYLSLGLELEKVHRVISYKQSFWLKEYIDLNTDKRQKAKNDFEKDFYKLMINSVFGKTMENVKNRIDFELVNSSAILQKRQNHRRFKKDIWFDRVGGVVGVEMMREKVLLNKPIIVGMCILDVSKYVMYDFHYNTMKPKYGENLQLLFTDTDSLCYHIKTKDLYSDLNEMKELLDLSNHTICYDKTNNKVYGKFKDETAGIPITHFCGERAKCYAYVTYDNEEHKKLKGIKKSVVKNEIQFNDYKNSLFKEIDVYTEMNTIRSYKHDVVSITSDKKALCPFDDKRYLRDAVNSYAYGHYKTK